MIPRVSRVTPLAGRCMHSWGDPKDLVDNPTAEVCSEGNFRDLENIFKAAPLQ